MKQPRIVDAARAVLVRDGLERWTVERVAREARCAKGLVHYHFASKWELLAVVAAAMRRDRVERRRGALAVGGAAGIDELWRALVAETESGEHTAWLALASSTERVIRDAMLLPPPELRQLAESLGGSLDATDFTEETLTAILTVLDGLQLPLVLGQDPEAVREIYDRFWLSVVS